MNNRLFSIKNEREDDIMKTTLRKIESIFLIVTLIIGLVGVNTATVKAADEVTAEMSDPNFWISRTSQTDTLLMTPEEIEQLNLNCLNYTGADGSQMVNIKEVTEINPFKFEYNTLPYIVVNGEEIKEKEYIDTCSSNQQKTKLMYSVAIRKTPLNYWPLPGTNEVYSSDFLNPNEPFVIGSSCVYNDHLYYYGMSINYYGWIDSNDLAICASKEEWLSAWEPNNDFVVTVKNDVYIDTPSNNTNVESRVPMGTILKLVPQNTLNTNSSDFDGLVAVYSPSANSEGKYIKEVSYVSAEDINTGFITMTQRNIISLCFNCSGNTSELNTGLPDDLIYLTNLYRCFGIYLPIGSEFYSNPKTLATMKSEELIEYVKTLPKGTIFRFYYEPKFHYPYQVMIYIGMVNDVPYFMAHVPIVSYKKYRTEIVPITKQLLASNTTWRANLQYCYEFSSLKLDPNAEPDPQPTPTPTPTPTVDPTPTPSPTPTVDPTPTPAPVDEIFTVTFKSNGGSNVSSQKVESDETSKKPSNPTRAGYDFVGWFSDAALTKAFNFNTEITADTLLYAKWKVATDSNAIALNKSLKVTQTGSKLTVKYGKVPGATSYKVYAGYSGKTSLVSTSAKTSITVKKLSGKKLDTSKIFQVTVEAYDGNTKLATSIKAFVAGAKNKKFTNTKSVKVAGAVSNQKPHWQTARKRSSLQSLPRNSAMQATPLSWLPFLQKEKSQENLPEQPSYTSIPETEWQRP